jgi:acetyltransferase EpsM
MTESLYIVGAGGHGRELHAYVQDVEKSGWSGQLRGYLDDGLAPGNYGRLHVLGAIELLPREGNVRYLTAFGDNSVRRRIVQKIENASPWTLIHPSAYVGEDSEIGAGSCLAPGSIVTANTKIGSHCILNVKASVSHDCAVGDFVNINPGAVVCGWVTIDEGAYIGAGAVIKDRVKIGAWSVIGAGTVVIRDIPPGVTAVGVPARVIK